jgi:hypothetical protein
MDWSPPSKPAPQAFIIRFGPTSSSETESNESPEGSGGAPAILRVPASILRSRMKKLGISLFNQGVNEEQMEGDRE